MTRQLNRRDFLKGLSALSVVALSGCGDNSQQKDENSYTIIPISESRLFNKQELFLTYRGIINERFVLSDHSSYTACPNYYPITAKEINYLGKTYEVGEVNDKQIALRIKR